MSGRSPDWAKSDAEFGSSAHFAALCRNDAVDGSLRLLSSAHTRWCAIPHYPPENLSSSCVVVSGSLSHIEIIRRRKAPLNQHSTGAAMRQEDDERNRQMKALTLTAAALVALAGPSFAGESLAKQVERHFAQDETGHDAVVLPEVRNSIVISSAKRDVSAKARQILATGDSWTDRYVAGTGTVFSPTSMAPLKINVDDAAKN